jgi:hypothetical protein
LDRKGLGGNVIFIDTENTFRAERIFQIDEHQGVSEPDEILRKIYVCNSAYVHEFEDKLLLLVVTENTKIQAKNVEDYREFIWTPKIDTIKRPVHYTALRGVITTVHSNSGLIKRCNKCKTILHDSCPNLIVTSVGDEIYEYLLDITMAQVP